MLRELIDTDLPADELERLARIDALLREAASAMARMKHRASCLEPGSAMALYERAVANESEPPHEPHPPPQVPYR